MDIDPVGVHGQVVRTLSMFSVRPSARAVANPPSGDVAGRKELGRIEEFRHGMQRGTGHLHLKPRSRDDIVRLSFRLRRPDVKELGERKIFTREVFNSGPLFNSRPRPTGSLDGPTFRKRRVRVG